MAQITSSSHYSKSFVYKYLFQLHCYSEINHTLSILQDTAVTSYEIIEDRYRWKERSLNLISSVEYHRKLFSIRRMLYKKLNLEKKSLKTYYYVFLKLNIGNKTVSIRKSL